MHLVRLRRLGRPLMAVLSALLVMAVLVPAAPAEASSQARELERDVIALVNVERAKQGLGALTIKSDITRVARDHSDRMASQDNLHHNPDFSTQITGWTRVSENVGVGPSVERIHAALMDSTGHRRNILDDKVTEIGVGVTLHNGRVWITQNFRRPSSGATTSAPSTVQFGDVASTSVHAGSIATVVDQGVAATCGTSRFCPTAPVNRAKFAGMLVRALDLPAASGASFDDVSSSQRADVEALYAAGLTKGCGGNSFCPDRELTREQMATFLARALELEPATSRPFSDVGTTHGPQVAALYEAGITNGCTTTAFCPTRNVTRAQTASMLARHFS